MHDFRLTTRQRRQLQAELKAAKDVRTFQRTLALLELDQGRPLAQVATTLGVTRQTLYNWIERYENEGTPTALHDRERQGRPTIWTQPLHLFLAWSLDQPPDGLGYPSVEWTVPLLREHLAKHMESSVSDTAMRQQLHRLGYVWKRPRYVLQPDPDREKKTQNSPTNQGAS